MQSTSRLRSKTCPRDLAHNFTIDTLVSIEAALGAPILQVYHTDRTPYEFEPMKAAEPAY